MKVRLVTSVGDIVLQLEPAKAPKTVENFVTYVRDGHYDGTIFHRVISDFMIQGGGMDGEMKMRSARPGIRNEADNGLKNETGTVAMARTSDPHSASAQFFINTTANAFLDHRAQTAEGWGYCVFGRVIDGMSVVEQIEEVRTTRRGGHADVPEQVILIERAEVVEE